MGIKTSLNAPNMQIAPWKVRAAAAGKDILYNFLLNNASSAIHLEAFYSFTKDFLSLDYESWVISRTDFLICIGALKLVKQVVFSRYTI